MRPTIACHTCLGVTCKDWRWWGGQRVQLDRAAEQPRRVEWGHRRIAATVGGVRYGKRSRGSNAFLRAAHRIQDGLRSLLWREGGCIDQLLKWPKGVNGLMIQAKGNRQIAKPIGIAIGHPVAKHFF